MTTPAPAMRIGELASRTGVSVHALRVWERRYGLLTPGRSTAGYRLYGPQDELRVREMMRLRDRGVPAAQAAVTALSASRSSPLGSQGASSDDNDTGGGVARVRDRLVEAAANFDGTTAQALLDVAIEHLGVERTLSEVVLPVLHETGERWERGDFSVAQEHFISNLLRSRMGALTLTWDSGTGPVAVLACPPGEMHDLGLLAFGVVIGRAGWRVHYLGADTPLATLATAVQALDPQLVVLSAVQTAPLWTVIEEFDQLPEPSARALNATHLSVAGVGATAEVGSRLGATVLSSDPVTEARLLAVRLRGQERGF